jgi:hypothetical protein
MRASGAVEVSVKPDRPSGGRGAADPGPKLAPICQPDDIVTVTPRVR